MIVDSSTAVVVCAGPSLDRFTPLAWRELSAAGALVAVNGASAARACRDHGVRFTCLAAMDLTIGLAERVPELLDVWRETPAWRVASTESLGVDAESYVIEVDEDHGVAGWSDDNRQGYKGGSTGMIIGNWLGNDWPDDDASREELEQIGVLTGKSVQRRGFRRIAYVGLDMHRGIGAHAAGAGEHSSGFAGSDRRHASVSHGWAKFCSEAARRGIDVVNLTPGSGLETMPRAAVPSSWVRS